MLAQPSTWDLWKQALSHWGVWKRSLVIGLTVGCIQLIVNQGDHWLHGRIDVGVVVKTIITPIIGVAVALFSAAGAFVELRRQATRIDE